MLRKFGYLLGALALAGLLAPAPAQANPNAVAAVTGSVNLGGPDCTTTANDKKAEVDGEKVTFKGLAMAGVFGNYIGPISATPIMACVAFTTTVEPDPAVVIPVVGHGHINPGATLSGTDPITGKCLRGTFDGGDFNQIGTTAIVKFRIAFTTGFNDPFCDDKKGVHVTHCVGAIGVAPLGTILPGSGLSDEVAGAVACDPALPWNPPDPNKKQ